MGLQGPLGAVSREAGLAQGCFLRRAECDMIGTWSLPQFLTQSYIPWDFLGDKSISVLRS